ncbi:pyrimidine deaminase [Caballeronia terrestris]|uniref:Pyrimidine deaminase n=1 Tax=Caballeronia terrestris TaxID=1226301 RepID=A0A158FHA3_9BURK|nr:PP0621 family protein [Caballeronia terrestris]SAL19071.1 pyrimidine deaminase [Caballeronia terrestris]
MRQILLLIFLFFASQWVFRKLRRATERTAQTGPQPGTGNSTGTTGGTYRRSGRASGDAPQLTDPLVRCAQCGVHTPSSESLVVAGKRFCCSDHAHRYAARPTGRDAR